ncbi:MAG: ABC transporter substrate-binding protein [Quisquiliibacterium sp.]
MKRRDFSIAAVAVAAAMAAAPASAKGQYDVGASDKEIKIGNTMPYSGPASSYGTIGKTMAAYFKMINEKGGVNGRKINFISLDDGYSPPKTVEQVRKLVEQEEVLFLFGILGTPTNSAIHKYVNQKKVPHLFVATGATKWGDPKGHPWTMGWQPSYQAEGRIYAMHLLDTMPNAKVGILFQNDDYGKDYVHGFEEALGSKAKSMIIKKVSYETTDPTVDSQIVDLKASGANVFFNVTIPKFAAQAIKKANEIGWKPVHYLNCGSASVGSTLKPAGLDASKDIISVQYNKDPTDPAWEKDPGFLEYKAFLAKYYPQGNLIDALNVYGYNSAMGLIQVLKQAGDNLTRANIMKQAASLNIPGLPMLLPGIDVKTSATDFYPVEKEQLIKFDGTKFIRFGKVYGR